MHGSGVRAPVVIPRRRAAIRAPPPASDVALAPAPVTWRSASASEPDGWHINATAVGKEVGRLKPLDVIVHFASKDSLATYCNDTNVTCTKQWTGVVKRRADPAASQCEQLQGEEPWCWRTPFSSMAA